MIAPLFMCAKTKRKHREIETENYKNVLRQHCFINKIRDELSFNGEINYNNRFIQIACAHVRYIPSVQN